MDAVLQSTWVQFGALGLLIVLLITGITVLWKRQVKMVDSHKKECWSYTEKMIKAFNECIKAISDLRGEIRR